MKALLAAVVAAQAELPAAPKRAYNPHLKSYYADLLSAVETVRPVYARHGLAIVQTCDATDGTCVTVRTMIVHSSGETLDCGPLTIRPAKAGAQDIGSAISYARRYSLMAAAGLVADDDDDGESAQGGALSGDQIEALNSEITRTGTEVGKLMKWATGRESEPNAGLTGFPPSKYEAALKMLKAKPAKGAA